VKQRTQTAEEVSITTGFLSPEPAVSAVKAERRFLATTAPILFNYRACVTAVIPLQTVTKPAVTSTKPSLTYKSSRRRLNRGGGEEGSREKT